MKRQLSSIIKEILLRIYALRLHSIANFARLRKKRIVFILGTPLHSNLGDQAITLAEAEFIKSTLLNATIITIPSPFILQERIDILSSLVSAEDIIVGHGGGNLGDLYITEELCRRKFIELFPENRIVIFPQTIHFTNTTIGRKELAESKSIYSKHKHLTLIAREQTSYKAMKRIFTKNSILLTPDIVLSTNKSTPVGKRSGLLLCFRQDKESKLSQKDKQAIMSFSGKHFKTARQTDTITKKKFFFMRSKSAAVRSKLEEFRSAELVLTDRLHGMVFAAITGTPCIAMANFNHKVSETYKWIDHLPYIKFCKRTSELETLMGQLKLDQTHNYNPDHFSNFWAIIKEAVASDAK